MKALALLAALITGVQSLAPIVGLEDADPTSDNYIVVLNKATSDTAFQLHISSVNTKLSKLGAVKQPDIFNTGTFKAYTLTAANSTIASLAQRPEIAYIERDQPFTIPSAASFATSKRNVQANAPWNLARISHRLRGSTDYVYQPTTGTWVYILDTGVRVSHPGFQGQAVCGFNAVGSGTCDDTNGHGTHVAGIASSQTYGVVRFAGIVGVRVLDSSGSSTTATIISGINWAVQDIQSKGRVGQATGLLAVGGAYSAALNAAVASAANSGLMLAVAAGSEGTAGGNTSPGSEPCACVVGATTVGDARLSSSNYGSNIDIWAPGQNIVSLWITGSTSTNTLSGTSVAAAHIAGLGSYFLALEGPRGAVELCERMRQVATPNVITGIPAGTANLLAYNLSGL
ncbi:subtilisin-like protein [Karstenula rhodostoma CBS 690.94]|uniref:Subtilisin-like protein n=1 Tax=Karstenula rhodostoma CBS 690.94 TaxID=1392251 RepID=A0A9P4PW79_9PLEO|nr:subtilisin-like protein [Karstenula rhodostoma CBS 690.94]